MGGEIRMRYAGDTSEMRRGVTWKDAWTWRRWDEDDFGRKRVNNLESVRERRADGEDPGLLPPRPRGLQVLLQRLHRKQLARHARVHHVQEVAPRHFTCGRLLIIVRVAVRKKFTLDALYHPEPVVQAPKRVDRQGVRQWRLQQRRRFQQRRDGGRNGKRRPEQTLLQHFSIWCVLQNRLSVGASGWVLGAWGIGGQLPGRYAVGERRTIDEGEEGGTVTPHHELSRVVSFSQPLSPLSRRLVAQGWSIPGKW